MNIPVGIIFLLCGACTLQATCAKSTITEKLLRDLMSSDNIYVRPNADFRDSAVVVTLGLTINAIHIEDSTNGFVKAHGYLDLSWNNDRLSWNPSEYNNISLVRIPSDRIWLPDIRLYNNVDARNRMYSEGKLLALVQSTGDVQYVPPVTLTLACDVTKSQDEVSCSAKFGSWSYDGWNIDVKAAGSEVNGGSMEYRSGRLYMIESNITREDMYYSCCKEPYPSITAKFKARKM